MLTLTRIPVVGGLAYIERLRGQPESFTATLRPLEAQRYFPCAIAVTAGGDTLGYVAPEISRAYWALVCSRREAPLSCPARRGSVSDHETSGVELLLDFSGLPASA